MTQKKKLTGKVIWVTETVTLMATHSSVLAWKVSWTEEPGGLQSAGSRRLGHDWATNTQHSCSVVSACCDPVDRGPLGSCPWDFYRPESWSRVPFPSPGDLPDPGMGPMSPALAGRASALSPQGSPWSVQLHLSKQPRVQEWDPFHWDALKEWGPHLQASSYFWLPPPFQEGFGNSHSRPRGLQEAWCREGGDCLGLPEASGSRNWKGRAPAPVFPGWPCPWGTLTSHHCLVYFPLYRGAETVDFCRSCKTHCWRVDSHCANM